MAPFSGTISLSHGRILASLLRTCGDFELAEDALQEAFAKALEAWAPGDLPAEPSAWIHTVARRKLIDLMRSTDVRNRGRIPWTEAAEHRPTSEGQPHGEPAVRTAPHEHDTLRLIFTCCHPALEPSAQAALALNALCGLTATEIAAAYLVKPATMAQRLVRAKAKIQAAGVPFRVPPSELMHTRLAAVLEI